MKYCNKEYKDFVIIFENNKPTGVNIFPNMHKNISCLTFGGEGSIYTYWDNEKLTEKPNIL